MNIREAKDEVKNIVKAYLAKDETGMPCIAEEHRRPVLLMGPPGIGKTAIMEQVASELNINLVSYTITHHTRQSAIGLPSIVHRSFDGVDYAVTEYTMSEIIAAVYEQIEQTGIKEGILFLDEINCVSETLAPTMLQFLQYKTFGTHKVPEGFIIVTAGNPPEYNQSVREFDIVTLDRLRRIDIEADFDAFKEYGYRTKLHGAILAYLDIRKDHFYEVHADTDRKSFVTARGWEDLSDALKTYEMLGLTIGESLMSQYLQDEEIASDFALYYELYKKYANLYQIPKILTGEAWIDDKLKAAPFDEKLSLISLLIDSLNTEFRAYRDEQATGEQLLNKLKEYGARLKNSTADVNASGCGKLQTAVLATVDKFDKEKAKQDQTHADGKSDANGTADVNDSQAHNVGKTTGAPSDILNTMIAEEAEKRARLKAANMLSHEAESDSLRTEAKLKAYAAELKGVSQPKEAFDFVKAEFTRQEEGRQQHIKETDEHLTNVFKALYQTFGQGQELVLFLSELNAGYYSLKFINECGNESYYNYNKLLLLKDRNDSLRREILQFTEAF